MLQRFYVGIEEKPFYEMSSIELAAFFEKHYKAEPLLKLQESMSKCDVPTVTGIPALEILEAVVCSKC